MGSKRVLVTGGAGFIGSHMVDLLVDRGCKVMILDNISSGRTTNILPNLDDGRANLVVCDIIDKRAVVKALKDVEVVYHLAAITSVPYSFDHPIITRRVNATGTKNLLEASLRNGVELFVNVSTCAVYGDAQYLPVDENHPVTPLSPYAESKVGAEEYCREFHDRHGLSTVTLRLFNVYGPNQSDNEYSGVMVKFLSSIRRGKPPIIYGDGLQTRDFVHVNDVTQALLLAGSTNEVSGEIFNIGSGRAVTINELCRLILSKVGSLIEPIHKGPRAGDVRHSWARIDKARRMLGFEPRISLETGLEDLIRQSG